MALDQTDERNPEDGLERLTNQGKTFRPVRDLELAVKRSRGVCLIVCKGKVMGTGF